ncbi:MAG: hypothetical protein SWH68_17285 [Thermodesulfobacteriota bacterium]|nr:hypothetical protein [Thermodesulfobacteriota bacterium]
MTETTVSVKGTILLDLVKQVRTAKDLDWGAYLTPEDLAMIDEEIMASAWYPDDFFYRISLAVYKVVGESKMEACFAYGNLLAYKMGDVYKNIVVKGDPGTSIERFIVRRRSFFRDEYPDAKKNFFEKYTGRVMFRIYVDTKIRGKEVAPVLIYSILGTMHELTKITGGKNVESFMEDKHDCFDLTVKWDEP